MARSRQCSLLAGPARSPSTARCSPSPSRRSPRALTPTGTELLWAGIGIYPLLLGRSCRHRRRLGRPGSAARRLLLHGALRFGRASVLAAYAPDVPLASIARPRSLQGLFGVALSSPSIAVLLRDLFLDSLQCAGHPPVWPDPLLRRRGPRSSAARCSTLPVGLPLPHQRAGRSPSCWSPAPQLLPESRDPCHLVGSTCVSVAALAVYHAAAGRTRSRRSSPRTPRRAATPRSSALVAGITFVRRQRHGPNPLLDLAAVPFAASSRAASGEPAQRRRRSHRTAPARLAVPAGCVLGRAAPWTPACCSCPGWSPRVAAGLAAVPLARPRAGRRLVVDGLPARCRPLRRGRARSDRRQLSASSLVVPPSAGRRGRRAGRDPGATRPRRARNCRDGRGQRGRGPAYDSAPRLGVRSALGSVPWRRPTNRPAGAAASAVDAGERAGPGTLAAPSTSPTGRPRTRSGPPGQRPARPPASTSPPPSRAGIWTPRHTAHRLPHTARPPRPRKRRSQELRPSGRVAPWPGPASSPSH